MDNEILVDKSGSDDLISVLNNVYEDMITQQKAFENLSQYLTDGWQGKGATGAERSISEILDGFSSINSDLKDLINLASSGVNAIDKLDKNIGDVYSK